MNKVDITIENFEDDDCILFKVMKTSGNKPVRLYQTFSSIRAALIAMPDANESVLVTNSTGKNIWEWGDTR